MGQLMDLNEPQKRAKLTNNKPLATHQISNRCKSMVIIIFKKTMMAMFMCIRTDHVRIMDDPMQLPVMVCISGKDINCKYNIPRKKGNSVRSLDIFIDFRNTAAPVIGPATNNRGEIQAVTKAIELAVGVGIKKLCINADSHFVIRSVTEWFPNWKRRSWRLSSGGPVKNETDFRKLDHVIESNPHLEIRWKYVPAHTGIRGNERADELARLGSLSYQK